jgi:hypothetical protein
VIDKDIKANLNLANADEDDEDLNDTNSTDIDDLPTERPMVLLLDVSRTPSPWKLKATYQPCYKPLACATIKNHNFWIRAESVLFICRKQKNRG